MSTITQRHALVDAMRRLTKLGLNIASSGNGSLRLDEDSFLVTPSGVPADELRPQDMVVMDLDGTVHGELKPSSEWRFHRDIYAARPEVGAVVHTHAPFCTTLAVLGRGIPSFHYMVAKAGGPDIRCAPYATYGTQELSDHALTALDGRKACILANHGMLAVGADLTAAVELTHEVENLAEVYWRALQVGEPVLLPADEMAKVIDKLKTYGRAAQTAEDAS